MKKLQVLGTGCPRCNTLAENTINVAEKMGIKYELEKVTDINDITSFGVMMTPALVVDGEVKVTGRVPTDQELEKMLGE
ncbi:MAG: thioredoxin family protein [Vulcanimicrobiota bacterium]